MPDAYADAALRDRIHEAATLAINAVYGIDDRHAYMGLRIAQNVVDGTPLPWKWDEATRVLAPTEPDLAWCGGRHPGGCSIPDSTGVCELLTRDDPPAQPEPHRRAQHSSECAACGQSSPCDTEWESRQPRVTAPGADQ